MIFNVEKYKVAIVTSTRAEYGLLSPLIRRVMEDDVLELNLIVTGGHLSEKQGMTIREIKEDGVPIKHEIPILEEGNTAYDISVTMANALKGFAQCFRDDRPDIVLLLGDRTEMLSVSAAAMNERIPIAHISGGDTTEGAVDECVRHAISKMSYLHFTSCEAYRRRVIQLGEAPDRVFNVGSLSVENIAHVARLSREELSESLSFDLSGDYAVFTYHPATLEIVNSRELKEIFSALDQFPNLKMIFTKANTDRGGQKINEMIDTYVSSNQERCVAVYSLGMRRYLSALSHASLVIGNSSSGIMETPSFGMPTVNIGDRQKGRIQAGNIINCQANATAVREGIQKALSDEFRNTAKSTVNPYGDGSTSEKIVQTVKDFLVSGKVQLKKAFHDINQCFN